MVERIQNKIDKLAETLFKSGIAASESEAKRMAASMVDTEEEVNTSFELKRQNLTADTSGKEETKEYGVNPVDGSPVNKVSSVPKNEYVQEAMTQETAKEKPAVVEAEPEPKQEEVPVQAEVVQEPIQEVQPEPMQEPVQEVQQAPTQEEKMTPEEFTAKQMNMENQGLQRAETSFETEAVVQKAEPVQEQPTEPVPETNSFSEIAAEANPSQEVKAEAQPPVQETQPVEEKQELPDLNPLEEKDAKAEEERKKKQEGMAENKIDLSKIFKV